MIENLLWDIGYFDFQDHDVNVCMASRIRDAEDAGEIADALQAVPSLRNGLVITPSISGTAGLTIAGCRFAEIGDVIGIGSDGLSCDRSRIASLAGVRTKSGAGAPKHKKRDEAEALIAQRYHDEIAEDSARNEAKVIASTLGDCSPSDRTLRELIRAVRTGQ